MKSLTKDELNRLLAVAGSDALMLRVMFNHGLRVSEVITLNETNVVSGHLVVQRLKGSCKTTQPLLEDEQALLTMKGTFFPMSRITVWRRMQEYGAQADIPEFKRHPHVMKHTTGRLGYKGGMGIPELQSYLGHKNGGNTLKYTAAEESEAAAAFAAAVGK
jgi:integrase/recombinase XerD